MIGPENTPHIESIINRFDAPFFFYDLDAMERHLSSMIKDLDPSIKLWYACKANPMSAILKLMRNLGLGIDVASTGELHQVLNTGINPNEVLATGPGKSKEYLKALLKAGIKTIVLESKNQAIWLSELIAEMNVNVQTLVRVQLDWADGKSVLGGNAITPFGLDTAEWEDFNFENYTNLNIKGFHVFQWGNILDVNRLKEIWFKTVEEIQAFSKKINIECEVLDLGGGLGIPYNFEDTPLEFSSIKSLLTEIKQKFRLDQIWMELGRYTVGDHGVYLSKIVDIKTVRGKKIIVCDGGINHIARVALVNEAFPATAFNKSSDETEEYNIHGSLCTALDYLGTFNLPSSLKIGEWLMFQQAGAYGFTESMPYFLCHMLPGEVIMYKNNLMIPRPPKPSFDWMI